MKHARKWRKRYLGTDWYFPSDVECGGKKDNAGYQSALAEWNRVKPWLDGLEPCPYLNGETGRGRVLIPAERMHEDFGYAKPPLMMASVASVRKPSSVATVDPPRRKPTPIVQPDDQPPWVLGYGFAPMLDHAEPGQGAPTETKISALIEEYLDRRLREVHASELSMQMYGEDKRYLPYFQDFLIGHYLDCIHVDQVTASVLSHYRAHAQNEAKSGRTLKKRLATLAKWMHWLADENFLETLPKDLTRYAKVKTLGGGPKEFFTVDQVKRLYSVANERMKLWILLGLNAGLTQREIATLDAGMINWETGVLERPRNKTGELTRARLWPVTLNKLKEQRTASGSPLLVTASGQPLVVDREVDGAVSRTDTIGGRFNKLRIKVGVSSPFKAFRKTGADFIEERQSELTSFYLSHATQGTKAYYVRQHFDRLFTLTDEIIDVTAKKRRVLPGLFP
ncbi:hypothetical protein GCM10023155_10960 [Bremerella cremea]